MIILNLDQNVILLKMVNGIQMYLMKLHSWNERQDSGEVPLIYNNNLKERFRIWRTPIPRHNKSLIRMRNGWQFIKLGLKNENNRKVILHDINVKYSI